MVDHLGRLVDGDRLLYVIALDPASTGRTAAGRGRTVMSNLGLELALRARASEFLRAAVGDGYVLEVAEKRGGVLGGETSDTLLCLDRTTTATTGERAAGARGHEEHRAPLAELAAGMPQFPQVMVNVLVRERINPRESERSRRTGGVSSGARRHGPVRAQGSAPSR